MSLESQELQIKMEVPIYPFIKVEFKYDESSIEYSTLIRKKPENSKDYYLTLFKKKYKLFQDELSTNYQVERFINNFHQDCYIFLMTSFVDETNSVIDNNQEPEALRASKWSDITYNSLISKHQDLLTFIESQLSEATPIERMRKYQYMYDIVYNRLENLIKKELLKDR